MMNLLENQVIALERARKNYDKAYRESDKALEHYKRADADLELSRAEVGCFIYLLSYFSSAFARRGSFDENSEKSSGCT
jgi:hypothetical protein